MALRGMSVSVWLFTSCWPVVDGSANRFGVTVTVRWNPSCENAIFTARRGGKTKSIEIDTLKPPLGELSNERTTIGAGSATWSFCNEQVHFHL